MPVTDEKRIPTQQAQGQKSVGTVSDTPKRHLSSAEFANAVFWTFTADHLNQLLTQTEARLEHLLLDNLVDERQGSANKFPLLEKIFSDYNKTSTFFQAIIKNDSVSHSLCSIFIKAKNRSSLLSIIKVSEYTLLCIAEDEKIRNNLFFHACLSIIAEIHGQGTITYVEALLQLGTSYRTGKGVPQDTNKARTLIARALSTRTLINMFTHYNPLKLSCTLTQVIPEESLDEMKVRIITAVIQGNAKTITVFKAMGVNMNIECATYRGKGTLVSLAVQSAHADVITALKAAGADVNTRDQEGWAPVHLAAYYEHIDAIIALKAADADIDITNANGLTAMHIAANNGNRSAITVLASVGADVNKPTKEEGATPLYMAAKVGQAKAIMTLEAAGAHVNTAETRMGNSALHTAVTKGHAKVVAVLLHLDASKDIFNKEGLTPLFIAAQHRNVVALKALLASGANANISTKFGTPLEMASAKNYTEIVDLLRSQLKLVDPLRFSSNPENRKPATLSVPTDIHTSRNRQRSTSPSDQQDRKGLHLQAN